MVNSSNFDHFRAYNFGLRLLREAVSVASISAQLANYNPEETARVTARMRAEAGLHDAVELLIQHYQEVIAASDKHEENPTLEAHAVSHYLRHGPITPNFSQFEFARFSQELARAKEYVQHLETQLMQKQSGLEKVESELTTLREQHTLTQHSLVESQQSLQDSAQQYQMLLERAAQSHQAELNKITSSRVWRLRTRLVSLAWLRKLYRFLFVREQ